MLLLLVGAARVLCNDQASVIAQSRPTKRTVAQFDLCRRARSSWPMEEIDTLFCRVATTSRAAGGSQGDAERRGPLVRRGGGDQANELCERGARPLANLDSFLPVNLRLT